jgi:hypothetical protein
MKPDKIFLIIFGFMVACNAQDEALFIAPGGQTGLWSSEAELKRNPVSGPAWEAVKAAADIDFSQPVINNNNSNDDVNCLASSIVYARTGDLFYKDRVIAALEYNVAKGNPGFCN